MRFNNFDDILFETVTVSRSPVEAVTSAMLLVSLNWWGLYMTMWKAWRGYVNT